MVEQLPAMHNLLAPRLAGALAEMSPFPSLNGRESPPPLSSGYLERVSEKVANVSKILNEFALWRRYEKSSWMRTSDAKRHHSIILTSCSSPFHDHIPAENFKAHDPFPAEGSHFMILSMLKTPIHDPIHAKNFYFKTLSQLRATSAVAVHESVSVSGFAFILDELIRSFYN